MIGHVNAYVTREPPPGKLGGTVQKKENNSQARVRLNLLFRSDQMQCKKEGS